MPDTQQPTTTTTSNDARIRAAMERLFAGSPIHTDGRLHVKNLATEAGLSRQQVYRSALLTEFNEHLRRIAERDQAPTEPHLQTIARLQRQLADEQVKAARYRSERNQARQTQQTYANRIALLDEHNRRLETALADTAKIASIDSVRSRTQAKVGS